MDEDVKIKPITLCNDYMHIKNVKADGRLKKEEGNKH